MRLIFIATGDIARNVDGLRIAVPTPVPHGAVLQVFREENRRTRNAGRMDDHRIPKRDLSQPV